MNDKELWALVQRIREVRHLANEADAAVYGIFGYDKESHIRKYREQKAADAINQIREMLSE